MDGIETSDFGKREGAVTHALVIQILTITIYETIRLSSWRSNPWPRRRRRTGNPDPGGAGICGRAASRIQFTTPGLAAPAAGAAAIDRSGTTAELPARNPECSGRPLASVAGARRLAGP